MFEELIRRRRSIRKYTDQKIEQKKVDRLVETALRAPSSRGFNPWTFYIVTDPDRLVRLSRAKPHGSTFLKGAPLGIAVCGDPKKCDVWIEDCSIAAAFLLLEAEALGLGACWIQIRKRNHDDQTSAETYVRQVLDIPESLNVECIIAIGYPDETKPAHKRETLEYQKVIYDKGDE